MKSKPIGLILVALVAACQKPAPVAPTPASDPESTLAQPDGTTSEAASNAAGPGGTAGEPAEPAGEGSASPSHVPDLAVVAACKRLCDQVAQSCDEAAFQRCRGACKGYVEQADGCEEEYQVALRCQTKADKAELCANAVATRCMDQFQAIKRCQRGETVKTVPERTLPPGWQRITDDKLGFTVALPASAALDPDAKLRTWHAQEGAIDYYAAQLTAPHKPVTSPVLLRSVLELVGYRCQKNLKLHGQFEIGDEVAILFDATCNDGMEWHGMLRVRPDQALATAFRAAPNSGGLMDPLFYSYERLR
ncbi:MAG: hypothetical protein JW751_25825 [Polyangiaceae bacterium]|nr:hypothetical protein [Polyangiaceae bacterium]